MWWIFEVRGNTAKSSGVSYRKPTRNGAGEKIRTPDPRITNALLYQLSYAGTVMGRTLAPPPPICKGSSVDRRQGEAGAGAAFDGGGHQPVDIQAMTEQLQQPAHLLMGFAVGGGNVAGQGIGGLAQTGR